MSMVKDPYCIAPPEIRKNVCASVEKKKKKSKEGNSLFGQILTEKRFNAETINYVRPAEFHSRVIRCNKWYKTILQTSAPR